MDDGFWDGDEPPPPTSSPKPTLEYEDRCANTSVYTSFDYTTASDDINDFCKGGVDLPALAEPV